MAAPPKGYGAFNVLDPNAGPTGPTAPGYGDFSLLDPTLKKPWWLAQ